MLLTQACWSVKPTIQLLETQLLALDKLQHNQVRLQKEVRKQLHSLNMRGTHHIYHYTIPYHTIPIIYYILYTGVKSTVHVTACLPHRGIKHS